MNVKRTPPERVSVSVCLSVSVCVCVCVCVRACVCGGQLGAVREFKLFRML